MLFDAQALLDNRLNKGRISIFVPVYLKNFRYPIGTN